MKILKKLFTFIAALCILGFSTFTNPVAFQVSAEGETIYRLHNSRNGEYFLTSDTSEKDALVGGGWTVEGSSWTAGSEVPVYRLFSSAEHIYTASADEKDYLAANGWTYEGVAFYAPSSSDAPVYRLYNPSTGKHYYTTDGSEKDSLAAQGWANDGICWYIYDTGASNTSTYVPVNTVTMPNPPFYSQKDGTWSYRQYGGYTIGNSGCGICVLSMIMSVRTGRTVYPSEMGDNLYNAGYYNNVAWKGEAGTYASSVEYAASLYGVACYPIAMGDTQSVANALASGQMVYVAVSQYPFVTGNYTHSLLLFGYDNENTSVYDPNGGRCNGTYSVDYIMQRLSYDPGDIDTGTCIYAF